ncbi:bifunctional 5,10-methylenetetrahydrofolate dehydrogenase/5,10-methenyltetrahydrofolate cyclohydrolase [Paenibacillus daejeonensis]|uniref:bifunctional 5,10-methylenetetrahydrofolate dehydrogenase/5,10-methenyltetrahydrofolate cyclohydrolase n=1 Tax=Paenibacillus daejeonensis TaxID=135193 RepID=UPI0003678DD8|nr:bifunctional 5,10-methylenetetrahydrofolate dehydrogenase/5,10-methenyltetrahydrofolate cyclohydrolase [Paenibacillus daejeonensis]
MTVIMKAREAADEVYRKIALEVEACKQKGIYPTLAVLLVEGDPASAYYAQAKRKVAEKLGINYELRTVSAQVSEEEVLNILEAWKTDPTVHGILLELPLPPHLAGRHLENEVCAEKDIDGVNHYNQQATITGEPGLYPATPQACIRLLKHYGYTLEGKNVTLVGRGQTVGMPLFHMLQREQATVTLCHSRTPDLAFHLGHADIAFVAVGRPNTVRADMVHPGLVVIDAGIHETEDGRIVGDVAPEARDRATAISPVPGGVGTLTTAILFENLMQAVRGQFEEAWR